MVAVGAVEDKKPTVVLDVDRCVAVVIAVRPERIGEQRVDYSVKVSPGLPTAVGADVGIVGAIRRVLVVLGLAACGGEGVVDAGRFTVKHRAIERKRLPVKCLLFRRQEIRRGAKPRSIIQRKVGISAKLTLYQGNTYIDSWSAAGTYRVPVSGECTVKSGKTYRLVLTWSINGVAQPSESTTRKCP